MVVPSIEGSLVVTRASRTAAGLVVPARRMASISTLVASYASKLTRIGGTLWSFLNASTNARLPGVSTEGSYGWTEVVPSRSEERRVGKEGGCQWGRSGEQGDRVAWGDDDARRTA